MAVGWIAWKCLHDPRINFLPGDARAKWIIFPTAPDPVTHPIASIDTTFRRTFTLSSLPARTRLEFRAAKRAEFKINGEIVPSVSQPNWKKISSLDVSPFLRAGENKIEARVFNNDAPPALWLVLIGNSTLLQTDDQWEGSIAGSSWRNCWIASVPRKTGAGNFLIGEDKALDGRTKTIATWAGFALAAIGLAVGFQRWFRADAGLSRRSMFILFGILIAAWLALFWNNLELMPFPTGYDYKDHVAYIKYIQDRGSLPLPNEGYEMFQPPLFYAIGAGLLSIFHLAATDVAAVPLLRALTMFFGVVNFVFVFLSMRLLFPGRGRAQLIGLLLAAFLPMQLYLSQYVTNETLAATLTTVSAYFAVRVLIKKRAATWELLVLGLCLGAAMLSKATSLLLIPPVLLAFAIKCWQERAPFIDWLRALGVTTAAIVLICGWHYLRIWRHFGTPIVGNWDPVLGFGWWQDPGFHTARDYIRFGRALTAPLFSGFQGIPDGLYSTLWGDSLAGGTAGLFSRSPWNYSLMLANYWVSIVPTILVLIGVVVAARLLIQRRLAVWVLLLGFSSAVIVALIFMTLKVPSYAQVKAFYGLSALVPFCAFAVLGWGVLSLRSRILELSLTAALIFLALNSVGSFWIRPTIEQRMYKAIRFVMAQKNKEALVTLAEAEKAEPSYAGAKFLAGAVFDELGEISKAVEKAREATQLDPNSGGAHLQLAISLGKEGDLIQAMAEAQRALELEPENGRVYTLLFALAYELHRSQDALAAGRDGLGVTPFDPAMHFRMGLTAGELGDFTTAVQQFAYALLLAPKRSDVADKMHLALRFAAQSSDAIYRLKEISTSAPDSPQLLNELAWIFSTSTDPALRDGTQALDLARRARELTGRKQPALLATEAAAYAESGKFSEAINSAQGAASLAQSQGDAKTVELAEKLLTSFQSNQPYREELH